MKYLAIAEFIRDALAAPEGSSNSTENDSCKSTATSKNLVGVVGPGSSDVTIQVRFSFVFVVVVGGGL